MGLLGLAELSVNVRSSYTQANSKTANGPDFSPFTSPIRVVDSFNRESARNSVASELQPDFLNFQVNGISQYKKEKSEIYVDKKRPIDYQALFRNEITYEEEVRGQVVDETIIRDDDTFGKKVTRNKSIKSFC